MKKFTLIELLVIIAIIGILVTMLLPSLSEAKKASKRAVCMSNLKQIGIATHLYIKNNNSYFPRSYKWPQDETPISWDDRLSPYDGREWSYDILKKNNPGIPVPVFYCPETPYGNPKLQVHNRIHRSYAMSEGEAGANPSNGNHVKRLGVISSSTGWALQAQKVPRPSEGIITFEFNTAGNHLGSKNNAVKRASDLNDSNKTEANFWYHKFGFANYLFADGGVRYLSFEATYKGVRSAWGSADQSDTMWDCRLE